MAQHIESDFACFDSFRVHVLAFAQPVKESRQVALHYEGTVVGEMVGDILKAANLLALTQQVEQRIDSTG